MSFWNNLTAADWQDPATYNMFVDAVNERSGTTPLLHVASGDDAQALARATNLQGLIIRMLDGKIGTPSPPPYSPRWFTTNNLAGQTASAYGTAFLYSFASMTTAVIGQVGFTRKRPLEFATMAATTYQVSGAAFVNGDNARCLADGIVYTRTAGAWVNSGVPIPDIFTVDNTAGTTADELNGVAQPGDIIGLWIYTEMRDILNLMLHRQEGFNGWDRDGTNNHNEGASLSYTGTDQTAAEADATSGPTGYDSDTYLTTDAGAPYAEAELTDFEPPDNGTGYYAFMARTVSKITTGSLLTSVSKTVRYFCGATRYSFDEWDGDGDFASEGIYKLITTSASLAAATASDKSAFVGDLSVHPTFPASTPPHVTTARGWNVNDANTGSPGFINYSTHSPVIIATYDFAYGPTTP